MPETIPALPSREQRLAARQPPQSCHQMYQQWVDLLFLHWKYPADIIQATLPDGLFVDTHADHAYLGVVPFFMRNVRPRFLPAVPKLSHFMELNLRTYVYDREGVPGVWFFSLDANQSLAVKIARRFFYLPYEHAQMDSSRTPNGSIRYNSQRIDSSIPSASSLFEYAHGPILPPPSPDSLEFFLVERYRLFSSTPQGLKCGAVSHPPYPISLPILTAWDENLLALNHFKPTLRPPDHLRASPGVSVKIFPLQKV